MDGLSPLIGFGGLIRGLGRTSRRGPRRGFRSQYPLNTNISKSSIELLSLIFSIQVINNLLISRTGQDEISWLVF